MFRATLVAMLLWLSGCAWLPFQPEESPDARQRDEDLLALENWTVKGRLDNGEQRAGLRWTQKQQSFDIVLRGPFGFGGLRLVGDPSHVVINDGKQQWESHRPAEDLARQFGWTVPLDALPYWMRGLPQPDAQAEVDRDAQHRVLRMQQHGWQLDYAEFASVGELVLPHQLILSRAPQQLTIAIRQWRLPES